MNAEALIGTVLGTCTLQKLVGQGGMGAVFLAQQSRPRRQVAVKILLPMAPLSPNQLAAFLERFRRETDAAASLEHPNIVPVHEYGERDGLAYLVMPYIGGGTLRDEMEREGPFPLPTVINYLDQMAAALDFAHGNGVIHRDIKPANILLTSEHRLLLTDFGLVKIVAEGRIPQIRLTGEGAPVGTPDYMAPEQVIGEDVDARADLYSLGVIVYQMVTGTTPFQGETPMQIAAQHLQVPPPAPHLLRPDLPLSVEQVILKALSKRPADRYKRAQELAFAFRQALAGTGFVLGLSPDQGGSLSNPTSSRLVAPQNPPQQSARPPAATLGSSDMGFQFRPTGMMPAINPTGTKPAYSYNSPAPMDSALTPPTSSQIEYNASYENMPQPTGAFPSASSRGGLLSKTGMFPAINSNSLSAASNALPTATGPMPTTQAGGGLLSRTGRFPTMGSQVAPTAGNSSTLLSEQDSATAIQQLPSTTPRGVTGAIQDSPALRTTMKLSAPMKVVKVPVAGQPGHFVTGLLSMTGENAEEVALPEKKRLSSRVKVLSAALALLIIFGTIGGVWAFTHGRIGQNTKSSTTASVVGTPDANATALVQATAAAQANTILSDPLDHNIHGWYESANDGYVFEAGAYHIINHNTDKSSATVLPSFSYTGTMAYTLTMQEIKGDDTSDVNSFGMLFRYSQQTSGKNIISRFYSFEVLNKPGGEYKFWKYDSSKGDGAAAWGDPLWHQAFGNEFHQGHGAQAVNTVKIIMDGSKFTFIVNGKTIKTIADNSYTNGSVGMIVNLNGTEVDFKNLLLTKN